MLLFCAFCLLQVALGSKMTDGLVFEARAAESRGELALAAEYETTMTAN